MGELSPYRRPDLCDFLGRAEPVKPRHQRSVQACRDRQCGEGTAAAVRSRCAFALRLQHRLGHFLDEQRNAIGALDNVLSDALWQRLVARDAVNHCGDFALAEPIESESSDVGSSNPRRLELRSVGDNQQHPKCSQPVHCATERFQARWVDPMHVLENHQHRIGRDSASSCAVSASSVFCRRCCGVSSSVG